MIWYMLAASLTCTDLSLKYCVNHDILPTHSQSSPDKEHIGKVTITKSYNKGAMLGLMKDKAKELLAISLVLFGIILGMFFAVTGQRGNPLLKTGLTLLLGGSASNILERYTKGAVTDYVKFNFGPAKFQKIIFNVGDFFIMIGALLALIGSGLQKK